MQQLCCFALLTGRTVMLQLQTSRCVYVFMCVSACVCACTGIHTVKVVLICTQASLQHRYLGRYIGTWVGTRYIGTWVGTRYIGTWEGTRYIGTWEGTRYIGTWEGT